MSKNRKGKPLSEEEVKELKAELDDRDLRHAKLLSDKREAYLGEKVSKVKTRKDMTTDLAVERLLRGKSTALEIPGDINIKGIEVTFVKPG